MHTTPGESPVPWRPDPRLLDGAATATLVVDRALRVTYANDASLALLGYTRDRLLGEPLPDLLFDAASHGGAVEVLTQALDAARVWRGTLTAQRADGEPLTVSLTCGPVWTGDEVSGAALLVESGPVAQPGDRGLADRFSRLARITAELIQAEDLDAVTRVVVEHTADAAGATIGSLSLLVDDDTLALVGIRGAAPGIASRWATFPLGARTPAGDAVRTGRMQVLTGRAEIEAAYPDLEAAAPGERSIVSLPLRSAGRVLGAAGLSFPGPRHFDAGELEFLAVIADTCAQAVQRVNALTEAADQATRLKFLADASVGLSSSLDYEATLTKVARLAVPDYADWCSIQLEEDGDLRTLAVAHVDPAKVQLALDLQRQYPPDRDAPNGAYNVLRTGESELIPEIPDELLVQATVDEEHLRLARELNLRSALTVPLRVRDRVRGVITWVTGDEGRRFGPADVRFAEDLAARASIAIDNAQLHSEVRDVAARLQRAVLPDGPPAVEGWDIAALYLPAGRTEVGGDFYDVVPLSDGRLVIFVGDVMGRGVQAAAAMAQMRSAVRAFIAVDPDPAAVMTKLDMLFAQYSPGQLVTLVCAVADPGAATLTVVNAGHPPPVVLRSDGEVEQLPEPGGPPLGAPPSGRPPLRLPFGPGDLLLAFTDGLIERRTEDIDVGQDRLLKEVPDLAGEGLAERVETLTDRVRDHTRDDDVAVVALRRR